MKDPHYTQNYTWVISQNTRSVRKESRYFYRRQLLTWWITKMCLLSITRAKFLRSFNAIEFDFPFLSFWTRAVIFFSIAWTVFLKRRVRARGWIYTANLLSYSKVVQQRSTCLALYRGKSIRIRRNGHNLPSSLEPTTAGTNLDLEYTRDTKYASPWRRSRSKCIFSVALWRRQTNRSDTRVRNLPRRTFPLLT